MEVKLRMKGKDLGKVKELIDRTIREAEVDQEHTISFEMKTLYSDGVTPSGTELMIRNLSRNDKMGCGNMIDNILLELVV